MQILKEKLVIEKWQSLQPPDEWEQGQSSANPELIDVDPDTHEWKNVEALLRKAESPERVIPDLQVHWHIEGLLFCR